MKMHAEKKHKCEKCSNSYGTEWDLKRHSEDCGKTFQCTCGCPYASRTALLSHIYRTGHEIPAEHREPPKKRRMEGLIQSQLPLDKLVKVINSDQSTNSDAPELDSCEPGNAVSGSGNTCNSTRHSALPSSTQKLLLPKPKLTFVRLPVMQLAHMPVILTAADSNVKPVVVAVDNQGSVVHVMPHSVNTVMPSLEAKSFPLRETSLPAMSNFFGIEPLNTAVQTNMDKALCSSIQLQDFREMFLKNSGPSMNVQTDASCTTVPTVTCCSSESLVSSFSQTDISFSSQVSLPVSVETQTFVPHRITASVGAQTDNLEFTCCPYGISRETQTNATHLSTQTGSRMSNSLMCTNMFGHVSSSSYSVSTQTSFSEEPLFSENITQSLIHVTDSSTFVHANVMKSSAVTNFNTQASELPSQPMTDSQTQTMNFLHDLENILSDSMSNHTLDSRGLLSDASTSCETDLTSSSVQNTGLDFDFEEFLSASNIQTQTEESEFGTIHSEPVLESLDIETQTDFLFSDAAAQSCYRGNPNYLGMEMFDTQTQTDLNFLLDQSGHLPLSSILKQSSFSVSTDSSDTETQTDVQALTKTDALTCVDGQVQLSTTETQTIDSCLENFGNLFSTTNETQTVMDDFLIADLAWNAMESQFSSVETQTCDELFDLLRSSDKDSN